MKIFYRIILDFINNDYYTDPRVRIIICYAQGEI